MLLRLPKPDGASKASYMEAENLEKNICREEGGRDMGQTEE